MSAALAFSLSLLLAACGDAPLRQLNTTETAGVFTLSIDDVAEHAVVGSVMHGGSLWRLSDGARLYDWNHGSEGASVLVASAFSPDGQFAATAERHRIVLWNVASGRAVGFWSTEGGIQSLALSGQGRHLLVGLHSNDALLIDTARSEPLARIRHGTGVKAVAITADGTIGITGSDDGMLRVWKLEDGTALISHKFDSGVSALALSPDEALVYAGRYHGKGRIWDMHRAQALSEIGHDRTSIVTARFSHDGSTLLAGLPTGRVQEWRVSDGTLLHEWQAAAPSAARSSGLTTTAVAFGTRPATVYGGFSDGSIRVWSR